MKKEIPMYKEGYDANNRISRDPATIVSDPTGLKSDVVLRFRGGRYMLGAIERGREAVDRMNGPKVPGPWAYTFQLSTCITANPEHSTKAESDRLVAAGLEFPVEEGDVLVIDDVEYVIVDSRYSSTGSRLELHKVTPYDDAKAKLVAEAIKRQRPAWDVHNEYQACVSVGTGDPRQGDWDITFGGANETFGASINDEDGEDHPDYLQTELDQETAAPILLAREAVKLVEEWLAKQPGPKDLDQVRAQIDANAEQTRAAVKQILGEDAEPTPLPAELQAKLNEDIPDVETSMRETGWPSVVGSDPTFAVNEDGSIEAGGQQIGQLDVDEEDEDKRALTVAFFRFVKAAEELESAWSRVHDDGNHPVAQSGAYPFAESFDEVANGITIWGDAVRDGGTEDDVPDLKMSSEYLRSIGQTSVRKLATILVKNAEVIPDPKMEGAADCYRVPLEDVDALRAIVGESEAVSQIIATDPTYVPREVALEQAHKALGILLSATSQYGFKNRQSEEFWESRAEAAAEAGQSSDDVRREVWEEGRKAYNDALPRPELPTNKIA